MNEFIDQIKTVVNIMEATNSENATYKTGDHVHYTHGHSYSQPTKYGSVLKHTGSSAHVRWEDGTLSIHRQSDGGTHGGYSGYRSSIGHQPGINHNTIYGGVGEARRVSNDEYKAHIKTKNDIAATNRDHEQRHASITKRLSGSHASHAHHFTKEHLDALDKIANEIDAKKDAS